MAKKKTKKASRKKLKTGLWAKDEIKLLKKSFPSTATKEIAAKLRRPLDAVKKKASRMGLSKSARYMRSLGRS